jgi:hypothetical protein
MKQSTHVKLKKNKNKNNPKVRICAKISPIRITALEIQITNTLLI